MENSGTNTIQILENGPISFRGDIEVLNSEGDLVMEKSKVALCRCGQSFGKPACDGTHKKVDFEAAASADLSNLPASQSNGSPKKLTIRTMKNGPLLVKGSYTISSAEIGEYASDKQIALCRCGRSSNKPFCDGTHKEIPFKAD